ncbi:uncharacterized protein RCC_09433 [Ramularia collo-cygni]|uniref:Uncharacterized protein n=1 Tax=Ramularia collo-cygni TaxID=112498 RepID=A0A2D3VK36_9PEZI|nr:uncharacterized protein RCC_09433 [Ramularia collo-cygni]CZT23719.1 uncharacterized protein RCC_09433 [Ramularia collo-cygni]
MTCGGILLGIIAIFFPPAPVIVRRGCGAEVIICIGLLFLGWIPGIVYAWYIILTYPSLRQRRRQRRRSILVEPREEIVYAGPVRRSGDSRRRSGGIPYHGYEGTMQPYHREAGWRDAGGQTGYYPPPLSEGRGRKR